MKRRMRILLTPKCIKIETGFQKQNLLDTQTSIKTETKIEEYQCIRVEVCKRLKW